MNRDHKDGATVLIVDDEVTVCRSLERLLRAEGYRVATAMDGDEAIAVAEQERPAATLLDIALPVRDGIATLRELRRRNLGGAIIMLTGHGSVSTARDAMALGAEDYITKPFNAGFLKWVLRVSLEGAPAELESPACAH